MKQYNFDFLTNSLVCHPLRLMYVRCQKCGTNTIIKSLVDSYIESGFNDSLAEQSLTPFPRLDDIGFDVSEYTVFSVVRNPYTRVLSAYLNRMVNNRDETFLEFEKQYQISAENLSFKDFLLTISRDEPASLDRHWRPLSDLLAVRLFSYDHIGKIENIGDLKDDLLQRFFPVVAAFESGQSHSTNSSNKIRQYYTADEIDLVNAIYEEDFINFRYITDDLENLNGEPVDVRQLDERADGNLYEVLCGRTPADIAKNAYDAGILHA
jgi:hypothetical protein